ncbi:MAG: hypothetical protein H6709_03290 [Kofleriaceae bacterium]|nr:hypothetical protein [Myxococcales bacterium]MCB9562774.1 hypothetical protein [Kofleriaceae bacterium]MCB9571093.1 hypothetical protein [Kofleriaceae bacterium]
MLPTTLLHRGLLILMLVTGLGSCVTPSIPIPPPAPERMEFQLDLDLGTATFAYPATANYSNAIVYVYNRTAGRGVIDTARADGSVGPTDPFPAADFDEISISFETDAQVVSTCIVLRDGAPGAICN